MNIYLTIIFALVITTNSYADKYDHQGNEIKMFSFGPLSCESHSNPTEDKRIPKPYIRCALKGVEKFKVPLSYGSHVESSKDGKYLLGLSNSGLDNHAFWLIDQNGKIVISREHNDIKSGSYCRQTISIIRVWVADNPFPLFEFKEDKLQDVKVLTCRRYYISLFSGRPEPAKTELPNEPAKTEFPIFLVIGIIAFTILLIYLFYRIKK